MSRVFVRGCSPRSSRTLSAIGTKRIAVNAALGGVQFDFPRLETEPLNLFVRENSFEPDDFICQGAMVEHLNLCLFVSSSGTDEQVSAISNDGGAGTSNVIDVLI